MAKRNLLTFIFIFGLILSLNVGTSQASDVSTANSIINTNSGLEGSETTTQTINVLIYNGDKAASDSVNGIKSVLDSANSENLVPGYKFAYNTSTTITSTILSSYDLLAMPGGNDYITSYDGNTIASIDATAIKNFISGGKGYLGICAGAFAGAKYTENCYYGWGVAPNVNCKQPYAEVTTTIKITPAGKQILGQDGTVTTLYWNGPAMTASGNAIILATYDGITSSTGQVIILNGMAAIVADYYGKGRSVLMGPHPELDPKSPDIIANLIVWAANIPPISGVTPPLDEIIPPANPIPPAANPIPPASDAASVNSSNNNLPMQNTGTPLIPLALATLLTTGGVITARMRK